MKKLVSISLIVVFILTMTATAAFAITPQQAADELNAKGLFEGTGSGYELDREMTRQEAITMFVKILGKNDEAKNGTWTTPFTDVEDWAKPYVGYAYTNGLTSGVSATQFGSKDAVSYTQYLTFVLKALGYEVGKDFQWDKAYEFSNQIGLTEGVGADSRFLRGDAAVVSLKTVDKQAGIEEPDNTTNTDSGNDSKSENMSLEEFGKNFDVIYEYVGTDAIIDWHIACYFHSNNRDELEEFIKQNFFIAQEYANVIALNHIQDHPDANAVMIFFMIDRDTIEWNNTTQYIVADGTYFKNKTSKFELSLIQKKEKI